MTELLFRWVMDALVIAGSIALAAYVLLDGLALQRSAFTTHCQHAGFSGGQCAYLWALDNKHPDDVAAAAAVHGR